MNVTVVQGSLAGQDGGVLSPTHATATSSGRRKRGHLAAVGVYWGRVRSRLPRLLPRRNATYEVVFFAADQSPTIPCS
jgi:hypothetical protein